MLSWVLQDRQKQQQKDGGKASPCHRAHVCWPEAGAQTARLPNGLEKWSRNFKKETRRCNWKEREVQVRDGGSCVHTFEFALFRYPEEPSEG